MTIGGVSIRGWFLLLAAIGTVVVVGVLDNLQTAGRVLTSGYETTASITGGQFSPRKLPFSFDQMRPRYLDQDVSLNLKWKGKDGFERSAEHVPITKKFRESVAVGERIRVGLVAANVIDEEGAIPVVLADASDRQNSLNEQLRFGGTAALVGYIGAALASIWNWFGLARGAGRQNTVQSTLLRSVRPQIDVPFRSGMFAVLGISFGTFTAWSAWGDKTAYDQMMNNGREALAELTNVTADLERDGNRTSYSAYFKWKDSSGQERSIGPTNISEAFWRQVTRNGVLAVRDVKIRYDENDSSVRPVIVADVVERQRQYLSGLLFGPIFLLIGLCCAVYAWRDVRRQRLSYYSVRNNF